MRRLLVLAAVLLLAPAASAQTPGRTLGVPRDYPTVQAAVDASRQGDLVLLDSGTYPGAVSVQSPHDGITIRGVNRNDVVFDGAGKRRNAIVVDGADGVALENMTAHGFLDNGFYWQDVTGFRGAYLTVWNVLGYGIYAEGSTDGTIDHDYVSGAADAAYYVGECRPCRATLSHVVARLSAVGYSGTNASGGLVIRDSLWDRNGAGILPNTYNEEARTPQEQATILRNVVLRSGRAPVPYNTPLEGFSGIGIGIAGGMENRVERNRVAGSARYGIAVFPTLQNVIPVDGSSSSRAPWRPAGNRVQRNRVRGSGAADLALSRGSGAGNCFAGNTAATTSPRRLQVRRACSGTARLPPGSRAVAAALDLPRRVLIDAFRARNPFPPVRWDRMPKPPPQANMP